MVDISATTDEWQECGGKIDIPKGWFVVGANFDVADPYIKIANSIIREEQTLMFPKPLAYYLGKHFCGSTKMHEALIQKGVRSTQNKIKEALGL